MNQPRNRPFRLLLASTRWAVRAYFTILPGVVVAPFGEGLDADAVVVDPVPDVDQAAALAESLHGAVPVVSVLCCPHSATPWQLQSLIRAGASVLDLEAPPDEAVRVLERVVKGDSVLHVHLQQGQRAFLRELLVGGAEANEEKTRLLGLLALGLPDHEIGRRLHLSRHTVKHRIEALRNELGTRNRIELAAWAGRHGFYA